MRLDSGPNSDAFSWQNKASAPTSTSWITARRASHRDLARGRPGAGVQHGHEEPDGPVPDASQDRAARLHPPRYQCAGCDDRAPEAARSHDRCQRHAHHSNRVRCGQPRAAPPAQRVGCTGDAAHHDGAPLPHGGSRLRGSADAAGRRAGGARRWQPGCGHGGVHSKGGNWIKKADCSILG